MNTHTYQPGDILHGFCGGSFGRDSYACRRVEAVGLDWIVTRSGLGDGAASDVELAAGDRIPTRVEATDTSWCDVDCDGPELSEPGAS